jgi:hypothetical protein
MLAIAGVWFESDSYSPDPVLDLDSRFDSSVGSATVASASDVHGGAKHAPVTETTRALARKLILKEVDSCEQRNDYTSAVSRIIVALCRLKADPVELHERSAELQQLYRRDPYLVRAQSELAVLYSRLPPYPLQQSDTLEACRICLQSISRAHDEQNFRHELRTIARVYEKLNLYARAHECLVRCYLPDQLDDQTVASCLEDVEMLERMNKPKDAFTLLDTVHQSLVSGGISEDTTHPHIEKLCGDLEASGNEAQADKIRTRFISKANNQRTAVHSVDTNLRSKR